MKTLRLTFAIALALCLPALASPPPKMTFINSASADLINVRNATGTALLAIGPEAKTVRIHTTGGNLTFVLRDHYYALVSPRIVSVKIVSVKARRVDAAHKN